MQRAIFAIVVASGAALVTALDDSDAATQSYRVGDRVEASPLMMNSNWESCTVTAVLPGGDVGVACGPRRTAYVVQARWVRRAAGSSSTAEPKQSPARTARQSSAPQSSPGGACAQAQRGLVGNRQQENGICRIGARVRDREGRVGTVIDAPDRTMCRVCLSDGTHRDYLTWMLSAGGGRDAAPAVGRRGGAAPSGNYQCYGGAAGNMRITISRGRWQGYYAAVLEDGRVGISSQPNGTPYYMVCERP